MQTRQAQVTREHEVSELFAVSEDDEALWEALHRNPAASVFVAEAEPFLSQFGDRCSNELTLETLTLRDRPADLLRIVPDRHR